MLELSLVIPAFFAGLLMFLAPCTLPVIPGYLAFISGVPGGALVRPGPEIRTRVLLNGLFFVLGFTAVFVGIGSLAGLFGASLGAYRDILARAGGVLIILFGLIVLGALRIPFLPEWRAKIPGFLHVGKSSSSLLIGALFALGWSPCIGPILGTILLLASSSATALSGALLLLVFSAGLAVPMLLTAALIGEASAALSHIARFAQVLSAVGGVFLIGIGVLMLLGDYGVFVTYGYELFDFIDYSRLLEYL